MRHLALQDKSKQTLCVLQSWPNLHLILPMEEIVLYRKAWYHSSTNILVYSTTLVNVLYLVTEHKVNWSNPKVFRDYIYCLLWFLKWLATIVGMKSHNTRILHITTEYSIPTHKIIDYVHPTAASSWNLHQRMSKGNTTLWQDHMEYIMKHDHLMMVIWIFTGDLSLEPVPCRRHQDRYTDKMLDNALLVFQMPLSSILAEILQHWLLMSTVSEEREKVKLKKKKNCK